MTTIAVLGTGVDSVYPKANAQLGDEIAARSLAHHHEVVGDDGAILEPGHEDEQLEIGRAHV